MSADSRPPHPKPEESRGPGDSVSGIFTFTYDSQNRITSVCGSQGQIAGVDSGGGPGPVDAPVARSPRLFRWEHLEDKRLFALTGLYDEKAGETEYWRDNPIRNLVVEVDDETGEFKPAVKHRQPVYLWLCREEREGR
jgi:hypothetical protein